MKTKGIMIMPETDSQLIKAKHWMISRGKPFKVVYLPVDESVKQPVIMSTFDLVDRILYGLTFGIRNEKISVYS